MRTAIAAWVVAWSTLAGADPAPPSYAPLLRTVAAGYPAWGRVDAEPRMAPTDCAAPRATVPRRVRVSEATSGPHGQKVYFLFASDRDAYLADSSPAPLPAGTTIVKESFELAHDGSGGLAPGARRDLFIMTKVGAADLAGTDAGWIYGTVTPAGEVTSAGRVASCMGCHVHAHRERLFGLRK